MKQQSTFFPGDEWLYLKIYCGYNTADRLIHSTIHPILEQEIEVKNIDKWFFIRFGDPDHHLRVRAHITSSGDFLPLLQRINKSLSFYTSAGAVWKIEIDTYQREIQRYAKNYSLTESWFFQESRMVSQILAKTKDKDIRWHSIIMIFDGVLNTIGYSLSERAAFTTSMAEAYGKEFGIDKRLKQHLAQNFRDKRTVLSELLSKEYLRPSNTETSQYINNFLLAIKNYHLEVIESRDHLASHFHMLCNRLFSSRQRLHELVIYDMMSCYYRSQIARKKAIKV